jgi:hypothetical protein
MRIWMPRACTLLRSARYIGMSLAVLTAPARANAAEACSCAEQSPPCAAFWQADAVFVGTAIDVRPEHSAGAAQKIAVGQVLRGTVDSQITIVSSGTPCDYKFHGAQQYLIYARRTPDGRWTTTTCAGTKPLDRAAEDVEFAESRPFARPVGQLYGKVQHIAGGGGDRLMSVAKPAAGLTISLAGADSTFTAMTDRDGRFEAIVPPGDYVVAPEIRPIARMNAVSRRITVPARGCFPVNFDLLKDESRALELTQRVR